MPSLNASDLAKLAELQTLVVTYKNTNMPQDVQQQAIAIAEDLVRKTCANRDAYWANRNMSHDDTCLIECVNADLLLKDLEIAHLTPAARKAHLERDDLFQEDYSDYV